MSRDALALYESVAAEVLDEVHASAPVDVLDVAAAHGFRLRPSSGLPGGAALEGNVIRLNPRLRSTRIQGVVGHELGHWALQRAREPDTEEAASAVGGAIQLPRRAFDADLRATAWSMADLQRRHPNASAELIARRIVELRDAVATIFDQGRVTARVCSPWLPVRFARLSRFERELAARALELEEVVNADELVYAVPVIEGRHRRVIVVAEAEQLELRFDR